MKQLASDSLLFIFNGSGSKFIAHKLDLYSLIKHQMTIEVSLILLLDKKKTEFPINSFSSSNFLLLSTLCYFNSIISNNFGTSPFLTVLVIIYLLVYKILTGRIQKYISTQMSTIIVSRGNNRKIVYTNRNQNVKKCWKVAEEQQWRSKCTLPHPHLPAIPSRQFFNKFRGF